MVTGKRPYLHASAAFLGARMRRVRPPAPAGGARLAGMDKPGRRAYHRSHAHNSARPRPLVVCLLLLALGAVGPAGVVPVALPRRCPGTWKPWKPFSAISSARTASGATPAEVKAFEATLLELNAILRRAPGVATPRGFSVETWGVSAGPAGRRRGNRPASPFRWRGVSTSARSPSSSTSETARRSAKTRARPRSSSSR